MKNCPSCGSPMADTAQFCNVCGARMQQSADMQQSYEQMGQPGYGYDMNGQQAMQPMQQAYGYDTSGQQAAWQMQPGYGYDINAQQMAQQAAPEQPVQQMQQAYGYDMSGQQMAQQAAPAQPIQQMQPGYGYDVNAQQIAQQAYGYDTIGQQAVQQVQQAYGYDTSGQQVAQQIMQQPAQQAMPEQAVQQQPVQQMQQAYGYDTNGQQAVQQTAQQAASEQAVQQQPVQQMQQAYGYDTNGQQIVQQAAPEQPMQPMSDYGYNTTSGRKTKFPDYDSLDEAQKEKVRNMARKASAKALRKKAKPLTVVLLVLLVLAAAAGSFVLGMKLHKKTPPYRKAAEKFLTAYCDGDVAAAEACCIEPCRSAVRMQVNAAASVISLYGDGAKMTYKIDEFVPYDEETVGRVQDALKEDYGYECDVSEAYIVKATLKITIDGSTEETAEQLLAIKIGKDWVIWYR